MTLIHRATLLVLIACLPVLASAQQPAHTVYLTADTPGRSLSGRDNWRILTQDIPSGADTALDDTAWPLVDCELNVDDDSADGGFHGFAWLRLHLWIDSTMAASPLAISISQLGASEVYLDGRLIEQLGVVSPVERFRGYDPQKASIVAQVSGRPGLHLLAIRYANPAWLHNARQYFQTVAGLHIGISPADQEIKSQQERTQWVIASLIMMFGVFAALALVHLVLFLFYRADRSNLLFSVFAAFTASCFLLPALKIMVHDPRFLVRTNLVLILAAPGSFCMLSILISLLFRRRRWPVWTVSILYVVTAILILSHSAEIALDALSILVVAVLLQVFIDVIIAMWRRVPGARILGAGVVLFTGSLLGLFLWGAINDGLQFNFDSAEGLISVVVVLLGLVSIPVAMSAYLAWRFASVNKRLSGQLAEVQRLSEETRRHEVEKQHILEHRQEELEREVAARTEELRGQKQKSDDLLLNILPAEVAEELKEKGSSEARLYDHVTVLFTDFVDFTQMSETRSPSALVAEIDTCFKAFDGIIGQHGLEKIKTVGDAYIAVSGLPAANPNHAQDVIRAALDIRDFMLTRKAAHDSAFHIRLGIHSGPVVAGIVGVKKFAYDIWGDTVNTAARMEQSSESGCVNISEATYVLVKDVVATTYRGELEAKHKGRMGMYFVDGMHG